MRVSCNGCRILRKGCNQDCILRPCLEWIKSPGSQANATIFLAKFYGLAGLLNLINAAPLHHRPAIFRSLLYEACGRIINPIYGSVGLMSSGRWEQCQSAVDSVLNGSAIMQLRSDDHHDHCGDDNAAVAHTIMSLKDNCDIRHLSKDPGHINHDRPPILKESKRSPGDKIIEDPATGSPNKEAPARFSITGWRRWEGQGQGADIDYHELHDLFTAGTVEPTISVNSARRDQVLETRSNENCEDLLELTLGWN